MEWQIMNCGGLGGLSSSLGSWEDDVYRGSPDCYENLSSILDQLNEDDCVQRSTRRQLASSQIIQKDLVPLVSYLEDDPDAFNLTVKLLVNLTQPVECLQQTPSVNGDGQDVPTWYWDIHSMLVDAKTMCASEKFLGAICAEMRKVIEDTGEYDLVESDCDTINQCLLLMRNLLHIQDRSNHDGLSHIHLIFLKQLFQCGIDKILLCLLNTRQKDYWGVSVVQLISLLYKDRVNEVFMHFEDVSSCSEESCDSSNCSQCEAAMDRPYTSDQAFSSSSPRSSNSFRESSQLSFDFNAVDDSGTVVQSCSGEGGTISRLEGCAFQPTSPLCTDFKESCIISQHSANKEEREDCENCQQSKSYVNKTEYRDLVDSHSHSSASSSDTCTQSFSLDEFGSCLVNFTTKFLQDGFSSLVHVQKHVLMNHSDSPPLLDDSYFLWSVAFFLKFARRKEIAFKNIQDVLTTDVFGFLVYEAISNGEEVMIQYRNNKPCCLSMRRLHLCVSALRELLKTLAFHREKALSEAELQYLELLHRDLANMAELRQVMLWLIRTYQPGCHSSLFLRDVIVTNHYFLLLLEEWLGKDYCLDSKVDMLEHVKQFASNAVMQQYGLLLQSFAKNDHHVNNCVFTMMHHVAGDCQHPETLLQAGILKTFLQIWDADLPVTQEMNDLMEYVTQTFLSTAEENPLSCAMQLYSDCQEEDMATYGEAGVSEEGKWTDEEEDKLVVWFADLEGQPDLLGQMVKQFADQGIKKSKLEVVSQLCQLGWLSPEEMETFMSTDKDLQSIQASVHGENKESTPQKASLSFLSELSSMDEEKVIPHCVLQVKEQGLSEQLKYIQKMLLETAYIKIDSEQMEKKFVEEPVIKYFSGKERDIPLVYYNDDQEKIGENIHMAVLLQQLGFRLEEETGLRYPRIPSHWMIQELVEKAKLLGQIERGDAKFDLANVEKYMGSVTKDFVGDSFFNGNDSAGSKIPNAIPNFMWMKLVDRYNTTGNNSLTSLTHQLQICMGSSSMDTE